MDIELMLVSFGKTAYVASCGDKMLDLIEKSGLSIMGTGDSLVFSGYDELEEYIEDFNNDNSEGYKDECRLFLEEAFQAIKASKANSDVIGDVVFAS